MRSRSALALAPEFGSPGRRPRSGAPAVPCPLTQKARFRGPLTSSDLIALPRCPAALVAVAIRSAGSARLQELRRGFGARSRVAGQRRRPVRYAVERPAQALWLG